jgi:hypothetical protein
MSSQWHRIGLYFGLVEETPDDRQAREALPAPSITRLVLGFVITLILGGAVFGILGDGVRSGVIFGAVIATVPIVLTCRDLWRRRDKRQR